MRKIIAVAVLFVFALSAAPNVPAFAASPETGSLVVIGDSIASGYGLPDYAAGDNYSAPLSFANMAGEFYEDYKNFAVDGRTSAALLTQFDHPAGEMCDALAECSRVIISIGGNDFLKPIISAVKTAAVTDSELLGEILRGELKAETLGGYSNRVFLAALAAAKSVDVDKTVSNISQIVEKIRRANPNAEITLLTLYDPFAGSVLLKAVSEVADEKLAELNGGIRKIAESAPDRIKTADVNAAFKGHESEFTNIGRLDIHPSAAGHYAIFKLLF